MHFKYFLIFAILCLVHNCCADLFYIDAQHGNLTHIQPDNFALWPIQDDDCSISIDAQYISHSNRYHVQDWLFYERIYYGGGAFSTEISIYDLQEFVNTGHYVGMWDVPQDCEEINKILKNVILQALITSMQDDTTNYMTSRLYGLVVKFGCKNHQQLMAGNEYHPCTMKELYKITKAQHDTLHDRRHN